MSELLVVKGKLKNITDCNIAGDLAETLSKKVEEIVKLAAIRTKANKRKTIKSFDL